MSDCIDEKSLPLRKPVTIAQVTYDKLDLREPTAGELEKASLLPTGVGQAISLISAVAKVPRNVVERLCQRDFEEASDFLASFNVASPTTGETSSLS